MEPRLLHEALWQAAKVHPDQVAVVDRERRLTYAELDRAANQVAQLLVARGVRRGDRVGLFLDKSLECLPAIYGVLAAGATYVPIDPASPAKRAAYILANCGARFLISSTARRESWPLLVEHGAPLTDVLVLDTEDAPDASPPGVEVHRRAALESMSVTPPPVPVIDLDLAYILYTSGSTGEPKGVMLSHLNAMSFVRWAVEAFSVGAEDRLSSHAPLHFDLSVFDLFAASYAGATVVLVPPQASTFPVSINRFIQDQGITIWYSVPSILSMLVLRGGVQPGAFPKLRTLLFAGEVFPTKYLRELMQRLPHVTFANLYGPTETNVCTAYVVPPLPAERTEPVSIGAAIRGVETTVRDESGRALPRGEVGELYVRGTTVMQGYWGDPERTSRTLIPDPDGRPGAVYRTGDLVREEPDGNLTFLGRRDAQIKSRGYRIELGEIEAALYAHPGVVEAAAVAVPDELVTNVVHAFVVVRDGLTPEALTAHCTTRLPRYMVPERFELRDALPKTPTGKVDRRQLGR